MNKKGAKERAKSAKYRTRILIRNKMRQGTVSCKQVTKFEIKFELFDFIPMVSMRMSTICVDQDEWLSM